MFRFGEEKDVGGEKLQWKEKKEEEKKKSMSSREKKRVYEICFFFLEKEIKMLNWI